MNKLKFLPPGIGNLLRLEYLKLTSNRLTELPREIGNLSILSDLYINFNQITRLPIEIINLRKDFSIKEYRDYFNKNFKISKNLLNI